MGKPQAPEAEVWEAVQQHIKAYSREDFAAEVVNYHAVPTVVNYQWHYRKYVWCKSLDWKWDVAVIRVFLGYYFDNNCPVYHLFLQEKVPWPGVRAFTILNSVEKSCGSIRLRGQTRKLRFQLRTICSILYLSLECHNAPAILHKHHLEKQEFYHYHEHRCLCH